MYTGPNTVNDGLVFGYDTGYGVADNNTATRFYPGALTTNIVPLNLSNSSWFNEYSSGRTLRSETLFGQPSYEFKSNDGQIWVSHFAFNSYDRSSNDLTLSVYAKNISGTNAVINAYLGGDFGTDSLGKSAYETVVADNTWRRYSWTRFSSAMTSNYLEFRTANPGVVISCPQLQIGRVVTPIVDGTRSSTESLIDLKKTTDINVSNVSFDSTGQPTFDGTDDTITFNPGTFPTSWQQPFSVEAVVYIPSGATWYNQGSGTAIIGRGSYTGSWGLLRGGTNNSVYFYMRTGGNTFNPGGIIGRDKFYHIVGTWDGTSQAIFYINGSQNSQETSTSVGTTVDNTGNIKVGGDVAFGGSNGGYGEGTFPVVKLYSKKLTATEIQQNYKAYKNRFNI